MQIKGWDGIRPVVRRRADAENGSWLPALPYAREVRRLVISDLHFGAPSALGRHPLVLERLGLELDWAEQLVINGDLLALTRAPFDVALAYARPFLTLVAQHVSDVVFVPGNQDHHFVELSADERCIAAALGRPHTDPSVVTTAERVLGEMMPGVHVTAHNPFVTLDGVTYTHGHLIQALGRQTQFPALDQRRWARVASGRVPLTPMAGGDYEALLAPGYELLYAAERGSQTPEASMLLDTWRARVRRNGDGARPDFPAWIPVVGAWLARRMHHTVGLWPPDYIKVLLAQMMADWNIPDGLVCYAHTHQAHGSQPAPSTSRWQFANSGVWLVDHRVLPESDGLQWHPGTLLRVEDGRVELRRVLNDLSVADLTRMAEQTATA